MIRIQHGDCMEFMKSCADQAFDLALCDPPYGLGEHGGKVRTGRVVQKNGSISHLRRGYQQKDWDCAPPGREYFDEVKRVSKQQIIWGVNYFDYPLPGGRIVWDKVNDGSSQSGAEIAYCSYHQKVDLVRYMWRGMMQGSQIGSGLQQGDKSKNEARIHPTQKPVMLYWWLLCNYAKPAQKIIDTHLGSGSSAIAAHRFGCDFIGLEIDSDYCEAARARFDSETAQQILI